MAAKLNVKIKPIGLLDLIAFKNLVPNRIKKLEAGSLATINALPTANRLAAQLHPKCQKLIVKEIVEQNKNVKTFKLVKADGSKPAYFRAGQYISVRAKVGDSCITRPYSLSSSPKEALEGYYTITVKAVNDGFFSEFVMDNWKVGTEIETSAPEGAFYYEAIRDASTVIGLCGGSGVTPFLSLAKAIAEGTEDLNLVILYGSCKESEILFKGEFAELEKLSQGRVKVVNVLSDEEKDCYEQGFITADLIKKYAPKEEAYSIFICGPQAMYNFVAKEIKKLKILPKFIRRELFGEIKMIDKANGYPKEAFGKVFKLSVKSFDGKRQIDARADESLIVALERAGIAAPSKCRSGVCGYCRSKLISGDIFVAEEEGVRLADKKFGFIHPCCSYPISDVEIELPPPQS